MIVTLERRIYRFQEKNDNYTITGTTSIETISNSFSISGQIDSNNKMQCTFSYEWTKGGEIISRSIMDAENLHAWDTIIQNFMDEAYAYITQQYNEPI